jgi:biotin transport system substrate-specific component
MKKRQNQWWLSVVFLLLIIGSAYASFSVPVTASGIPFTMQSLVIFIVSAFMTPKVALLVLTSYILLGITGIPVFAEGSSGWSTIAGGSGGFLYGFLVCAWFIAFALSRNSSRSFPFILAIYLKATLLLFAFGVFHLSLKYGFQTALEYGFYPFWKVGVIKAILAALFVFLWIKHDICAKLKNINLAL